MDKFIIDLFTFRDSDPTITHLSDGAYRLYINMLIWAADEGTGIAPISRIQPEHYETPANIHELLGAGLIRQCFNAETGEGDPHSFFITDWDTITV